MNTIKFLPDNYVKLTMNGKTKVISKIKYTRYYDKEDKRYNSWPYWYVINQEKYA